LAAAGCLSGHHDAKRARTAARTLHKGARSGRHQLGQLFR
jgi:hypothetical protein